MWTLTAGGQDGRPPAVRLHPAESDRLDSLASYAVLDTAPDPAFDAITEMAAQACRTPVAAIGLVDADRHWYKSLHGADVQELPRELAFCSDVVADAARLVVEDLTLVPRYSDHPMVVGHPHARAYAGVPLVGRDGLPVGALCVVDDRRRDFSEDQLHTLDGLADHAVALLEQHRRDRSEGLLSAGLREEARDPVRLRRALEQGELVPHYQPIVRMGSGRPYSLEALLRWQHPQAGLLPPSAFLPAVETSALVVPVGRHVLDAALAQMADLTRRSIPLPGGIAVNVASGQLARPGLAATVLAALQRHGVHPELLTLEITEATALPDQALARAELTRLADAGVQIVIDDYGVGWSNLTRVLELPVTALKLDRSLAATVLTDPRAATMVRSTVTMAGDLGLRVVAEGVETEPVRRYLAGVGCQLAQGWLFSPAVAGDDLPRVLARLQGSVARPHPSNASLPRTA